MEINIILKVSSKTPLIILNFNNTKLFSEVLLSIWSTKKKKVPTSSVYTSSHSTSSHDGTQLARDFNFVTRKIQTSAQEETNRHWVLLQELVIRSPDKHLSLIYVQRIRWINPTGCSPRASKGCFFRGNAANKWASRSCIFGEPMLLHRSTFDFVGHQQSHVRMHPAATKLRFGASSNGDLHITFNYHIHRISAWHVTPQEFTVRMFVMTAWPV